MAVDTTTVSLPEHIVQAADSHARLLGLSREEWLAQIIVQRLDTQEGAEEFFRLRGAGAQSDRVEHVLKAAPDVPPLPGDELPDDVQQGR